MSITIYHYPNCGTCKKARKWLAEQGREGDAAWVHLVEQTPSADTLRDLHERSGLALKRFFNTSGRSYRSGNFKERLDGMSDADQYAALAADGMLIKRPILDTGAAVLVGFKAEAWAEALG
ncbi:MAG: ArsC family transcriptional regulator [Myxococcales bacterium]|nr:ArsC family transcriptional regulator [Myxococcales bacterium]